MVEGNSTFRLDGLDAEMPDALEDDHLTTRVRVVAIPKFHHTGELVLVDTETLDVEVVKFQVFENQEKMK